MLGGSLAPLRRYGIVQPLTGFGWGASDLVGGNAVTAMLCVFRQRYLLSGAVTSGNILPEVCRRLVGERFDTRPINNSHRLHFW